MIDFDKTTLEVHNFIRGMSPFPTAWTLLDGEKLKVFKTKKEIQCIDEIILYIENGKFYAILLWLTAFALLNYHQK